MIRWKTSFFRPEKPILGGLRCSESQKKLVRIVLGAGDIGMDLSWLALKALCQYIMITAPPPALKFKF